MITGNHLTQLSERLFAFEDACNVYLVRDGTAGLLIDAGSGAITEVLYDAGVTSVEWVLHTHFHRDQCWGTPRLQREHGARVAVPEYERYLFESAGEHWRTKRIYNNYNDRNTFFSPGQDIAVDATLDDYERFRWRDIDFLVLPAKGHTAGSSALLAEIDGRRVAFTGDLMTAGGHLHQLHALEYGYGEMSGVLFTLQSLQALRRHDVELVLPSHGAAIETVARDVDLLERRLMELAQLGNGLAIAGQQQFTPPDVASVLPEPQLVRLSEHLLWSGPWACSNFYVLLSGSGQALLVDYGHAYLANMHYAVDRESFETMRFVEHHLDELRERFGVEAIEVALATHIHDDHVCGIPHLRRHHGTACWALDTVATVLAQPAEWASTPCLNPKPIRVDRAPADGERVDWRGYELTFHHAPGQTEFHSVISVEVDGRTVAFTGDNYGLVETEVGGLRERRPIQSTVLRNSFQLAMHRRCVEVMRAIEPELICPGHGDVLPCDKRALDQYADYVAVKEELFRALVARPADHYIDLFWARLRPYLARTAAGETVRCTLMLRNNLERPATYGARLLPPPGWPGAEEVETCTLAAGEHGELELELHVPDDAAAQERVLVTAEIFIDGRTHGPIAEALVSVVAGA